MLCFSHSTMWSRFVLQSNKATLCTVWSWQLSAVFRSDWMPSVSWWQDHIRARCSASLRMLWALNFTVFFFLLPLFCHLCTCLSSVIVSCYTNVVHRYVWNDTFRTFLFQLLARRTAVMQVRILTDWTILKCKPACIKSDTRSSWNWQFGHQTDEWAVCGLKLVVESQNYMNWQLYIRHWRKEIISQVQI